MREVARLGVVLLDWSPATREAHVTVGVGWTKTEANVSLQPNFSAYMLHNHLSYLLCTSGSLLITWGLQCLPSRMVVTLK